MTRIDKLLARMRNNPKHVRFEEVDLILLHYGFIRRQKGGGSSHYSYSMLGVSRLTIPYRKPFIHHLIIRQVLEAIDEIPDDA